MKENAQWVALPLTFDESVGVKWNAEGSQIESVDWERVLPAIHKASRALAKQLDKVKKQGRTKRGH